MNAKQMVESAHKKIAKIRSTHLGPEDHGIFTTMLHVEYGGSGQGIGGYALDSAAVEGDSHLGSRRGTALGLEWIMRTLQACGVSQWERLVGRTIYVYFEKAADVWSARPIGIGPLPTEDGEPFCFAELIEKYREPKA